ncbi:MAG: hypothetical protein EXR68_06855, partial [Dehalococcoidia bacterium]|nr:hypothetical protein [Dehalococcoidia bacterium]
MATGSYWTGSRVSRRSVLRSAGVSAAGLTAAALIGCSSFGNAPSPAAPAGPASGAAGASGKPRRGGVLRMKFSFDQDPDSFDINLGLNPKSQLPAESAYSRMMKNTIGDGVPAPGSVEGDVVE